MNFKLSSAKHPPVLTTTYLLAIPYSLHIVFFVFFGLLEQWIEYDLAGRVNPLGFYGISATIPESCQQKSL
ncbi:MAG: hypothetical protein GY699_21895 [Desulfobacteraceae bacterium]|nr:hypothetical protein [Desulfobacteraceae bacterium]